MSRPPLARTAPVQAVRAGLLAVAALGLVVVLWRLRPSVTIATGSPDAGIVAGCEWLSWLLTGYLAIAVTLLCVGHVSRAFGIATSSLRAIAPARLRRLVDATISIGVAGAIVGSAAAAPASAAASSHILARPPTVAGSPFDWPGLSPVAAASMTHYAHPPAHRPSRADRSGHQRAGAVVVVQPGDTLWTIASHRLGAGASGAAITAAWHAWYAANRSTIGPDPNLIRPGQRLAVPAVTTGATVTSR